jgi:hypothetical protein
MDSVPDPTDPRAKLPAIAVRSRRLNPLVLAIVFGTLTAIFPFSPMYEAWSWWLRSAALGISGTLTILALWKLCDRRPWLVITTAGLEMRGRTTLKWNEMVHIEVVRVPRADFSSLAIFVTDEAAKKLPPASDRDNLFMYAGVDAPMQQRHVWINDANLEYTAQEIASELEARRNGAGGPLTARVRKKS